MPAQRAIAICQQNETEVEDKNSLRDHEESEVLL